MALEYYALSTLNAGTGVMRFGTAAEAALIARTDLTIWLDARGRSVEASNNDRFTEIRSRKASNESQQPKVVAPSEAQGVYGAIVPGGTERYEFRVGLDEADADTGGFNNKLMTGNETFVVPSGDFTIYAYVRVPTPASITMLMGTSNTTNPMAVAVTASGVIRWYAGYSGTFIATAAAAWPDQNYHKLKLRYDSAALKGEISVDGVVVKVMTALDLSALAGETMNLGTIVSGGGVSTTAGIGWAFQSIIVVEAIDGVTTGLLDTVLAERAA